MRAQGKIHYLGGKQELVRLGYLKDKHLCVLVHAANFEAADYEGAVIYPTKVMAMTVIDLLYGEAEEAQRVIREFKPEMTADEYLAFLQKVENAYSSNRTWRKAERQQNIHRGG